MRGHRLAHKGAAHGGWAYNLRRSTPLPRTPWRSDDACAVAVRPCHTPPDRRHLCLRDQLTKAGHQVDVTEAPSKDLTADNLGRYDVLLLNYRNMPQGAKDNPAS